MTLYIVSAILVFVFSGLMAMAGLGAAFYTTLIGSIIGGVIIRLLSHLTESTITEYCSYIAEITEVNILPNMRTLSHYVKSANREQ